MKRFFKPLAIGVAVLSALSAASFCFIAGNEEMVSGVGVLSNIVSIISAALLFGISLLAYQKFNASQQTTDKKAEKVFELIRCLQEIRLSATYNTSKASSNLVFNIHPVSIKKLNESINKRVFNDKSKEDSPHYFDESVLSVYQDLISLSEDIFMPKIISKMIQDSFDIEGIFSIETIPYADVNNSELVVYANRIRNSKLSLYVNVLEDTGDTPEKVLRNFNDRPVSADKFIEDIQSINKLALKWIKDNSPYVTNDLNI